MDITKSHTKRLFRVGLNEGVVISIDSLNEISVFTDGLSGCVALSVIGNKHIFMSHVSSGTKEKLPLKAKQYLNDIVEWMQSNGNNYLEITFVANGLKAKTIMSFIEASKNLPTTLNSNIVFIKKSSDTSCIEKQEEDIIVSTKKLTYNTYSIVGSKKRPDLVVKHINANNFRGGEVFNGDFDELFETHIIENNTLCSWDWESPALLRSVSDLISYLISDMDFNEMRAYKFAAEILKEAQEMNITNTRDQIRFCNMIINDWKQKKNKKTNILPISRKNQKEENKDLSQTNAKIWYNVLKVDNL